MTKRLFLVLLCCIIAWTANAEIASGTGWNIDDDGVLTISGNITGIMGDSMSVPWFEHHEAITRVKTLPGSSVNRCSYLFYKFTNCTSFDLSNLNVSNVADMHAMFRECSSLDSLDVSGFNTENVRSMARMFYGCSSLTSLDVSGFNTANVTSMANMFQNCNSLTSLDVSGFNTENVASMTYMFYNCSSLTSLDVSGFNTENVASMAYMFYNCSNVTNLDVSGFNTAKVTDMKYMFAYCSSLSSLNVSGFNTENVTSMAYMFYNCSNVTNLDVSGFNTAKVTDMKYMFAYCSSLSSLNVSGFNTENVTSMGSMFRGCSSLTSLDVSGFNTVKVTSMAYMFAICSNVTNLDVSGFNTAKVTNMACMFRECSRLTSLDVSEFNTANVTDMSYIFFKCNNLTVLNVSGFNTENMTNMTYMFYQCNKLDSLDVSNFNTANVTNMKSVFSGCSGLVYLDLSNWDRSNVSTDGKADSTMFTNCRNLREIKIRFDITGAMNLPYSYSGNAGFAGNWYNAETGRSATKNGSYTNITLSSPGVAETWVRGKTVDNLLWTSNEDNGDWRNYGNWATVKNGDTITIDALPVHTSPIPITIPATANQPEYGSNMGSVRLMNGDTLILEYGALMDTKNLGVTLGAMRTSLVVRGEDRGEWILAGPNLKMKEGDGTREQLSGDYYLNKLPWVYMHEISIEQGTNPTISWQNAFPQLTEVLTPESAFAIRVDNKYGKYGINSERYYSKDSVKKHLGEQDVTFTFEGMPYPTPTFSVPADNWTVITNTTTGNISIADLLNNKGGQAAVWNFNTGSKGNKGSWNTYANAAAAEGVYVIPATAFLYKPTADMTADQVLAYTDYTLSGKYHVTAALDGVPDPTLTLTAANGKYASQTSVVYNAFISDEETEEPTNNALKVFSSYDGVPDICSYNGGTAYFSRTVNGSTTTVPLGVSATSDMTFTLTAQGAENFKAAVLDDRLTGISYNLKTQAALEFDIEAGENKDRFFLNLEYDDTLQPTTDIDENATKNIIVVCNGQMLNTISDIDDILSVQLTDMAGRKITRNVNARSDAWELKNFASGVYIAKVTTSSSTKTVKITVK